MTAPHPFEEREVPDPVREALSAAARVEGATLTFPTSWHLREVLELVQEAEARDITDLGSDQDLARWTRIDASSVGTADDGVPQPALLGTSHDHPEDWLRAGQAMERVLLLATLEGLSSSFATQPLEWTDVRWPLRDPVSGTGYTQMLLRLGYGPKGRPQRTRRTAPPGVGRTGCPARTCHPALTRPRDRSRPAAGLAHGH